MIKSKEGKAVLVPCFVRLISCLEMRTSPTYLPSLQTSLNEGVEKMRDGAKDMIDPIIQKTGEISAWRSV